MNGKKKMFRDSKANANILIGLLLAAVLIGGAAWLGVINVERGTTVAGPTAGAGAGTGFAPAPQAQVPTGVAGSGITDRAQMAQWNDKTGPYLGEFDQATNILIRLTDRTSGATNTGNGFIFWPPTASPDGTSQPTIVRDVIPGTENTASTVKAEGYYFLAFVDGGNTLYPFSYCDPEGTKLITPCQLPVRRNVNLARASWSTDLKVRSIGAIADMIEENTATDDRNTNWANGQSNITNPTGGDASAANRCLVVDDDSDSADFPALSTVTTPVDGGVIGFNRTNCANFYIEIATGCGGTRLTSLTSQQWCLRPTLIPEDRHGNMSSNEVDTVTFTHISGNAFNGAPTDVTTHFRNELPIPLYSSGAEWVASAAVDYHRLSFATNTNWGIGECYRLFADDLGERDGWLVNSSFRGSANQNIQICRWA